MNEEKAIPSQAEVSALRIERASAVVAFHNAVVSAIIESEEGAAIEVSTAGQSTAVVDAVIAKFADSDWTVTRKEGETKLVVTPRLQPVVETTVTPVPAIVTPADTAVAASATTTGGKEGDTEKPAVVAPGSGEVNQEVVAAVAKPIPETRFSVCRVNRAHSAHPSTTLAGMFEQVLTGKRARGGSRGEAASEAPPKTLEAVSDGDAPVVSHFPIHGLVAAADLAFRQHYPLLLTPDHIWLTVTQGLAAYIAQDPEKWRPRFVAHEGKEVIRILRNEFIKGAPDNDWAGCFGEFSDAIRAHIGDETHSLIISDFATTGPVEKAVSQIVLMDSMQSYFEYRVATLCGIPEIILRGDLVDWQKLTAKVTQLNELYPELNPWLRNVLPIVKKLEAAADGRADTRFFEDIFKQKSESGGEKINGWLLKLFPFCKDWRDDSKLMVNPLLDAGYRDASIRHDRLLSPVSKVPFIWEYLGTEQEYEFLGGIVAVEQDPKTLALSPRCAWAVRPKQ